MRLSRPVRLGAASSAVVAGAAALVLNAPTAAFAQQPSLSIATYSPATVIVEGAAARVYVNFTCTSPQASIAVSLTQRAGNRIANALGIVDVTCTGSPQQTSVVAVASNAPIHSGAAFADSMITGCSGDSCANARDQRVIQLRR